MAVSDAAMLAPEEVFDGKGDIKEDAELTQAERKRRRANKKRRFKGKIGYAIEVSAWCLVHADIQLMYNTSIHVFMQSCMPYLYDSSRRKATQHFLRTRQNILIHFSLLMNKLLWLQLKQ